MPIIDTVCLCLFATVLHGDRGAQQNESKRRERKQNKNMKLIIKFERYKSQCFPSAHIVTSVTCELASNSVPQIITQDNALFHIFSGPLFANVEGYAYLDLLVWGLSPLSFLFLRDKFFNFFRNQSRGVRDKTFKGTILLSCVLFTSYFFLNYSPIFNWNYFSRTFNIEVGYFIFDMLIRTFQLLVQIQEQKQPDKECQTYCQFQHATITLAYFIVFYLASTFQVNQRNNGPLIFALCCIFSGVSVILLPTLYYFHHRDEIQQYKELQLEDEYEVESQINHKRKISSEELFEKPVVTIRKVLAVALINISVVINMNYFSLWMMEPLGTTTQSSYQQYNITIQMVSGCFLFSCIGYYIAFRMFIDLKLAPLICRIILVIYGVFLSFTYWNYQVNYVSALILGFGFHQVCGMEYAYIIRGKWHIDLRFYLKNQVFAYFVMPLVFMLFNIGQTSLKVYALVSGISLIFGVILV